ncbi:MAG: dihydrolipoyl dehydrogenase [Rhodobacteraceae bacterium]|nr:dihydrolipoyl dehydrogenase [Paracoccaceae bacterium]
MANYDVIVIGAGPGGYVCAIRCAQLGLKTACVEGRDTLGGTCLNVGCIPSKALLHASHRLHEAEHTFARMGLIAEKPKVDFNRMLAYKAETVKGNTTGIEFLFKKNKVDWLKGWGRLAGAGRVDVGGTAHSARHIVIATGSVPAALPGIHVDEQTVVTSTGALALKKVPDKLVVIGAGVIGLELGSVYARLGAEVTVIEFLPRITPGLDAEVAKTFQRILKKQGINFILNAAVSGVDTSAGRAKITFTDRKKGTEMATTADIVLVATGRRPFTDGLGFADLGGEMTERGQVAVNAHWVTSLPGIYAIGDVIEGPMLAHKAEDEGMAVAEIIAGKAGHVNYDVIPGVIYTAPEVAHVGATEESLKDSGIPYKAGKFPFMGNARAKLVHQADGFVKLLAHAETDRILGCHVIGPAAGDLIHEICVAMEFGASAEDLALTCHAHPTCSEALREAALACGDGAIHA